MSTLNITSNPISQWLRYYGVIKPSKWFYEWTGATVVEKTSDNSKWYFEDNINAYTEQDLDEMLPTNVAVNENIKEIGYRPDDSMADKKAKLLLWLIKNNLLIAKWYRPDIRAMHEKHGKEPKSTCEMTNSEVRQREEVEQIEKSEQCSQSEFGKHNFVECDEWGYTCTYCGKTIS